VQYVYIPPPKHCATKACCQLPAEVSDSALAKAIKMHVFKTPAYLMQQKMAALEAYFVMHFGVESATDSRQKHHEHVETVVSSISRKVEKS
jgi:hypothetical protein